MSKSIIPPPLSPEDAESFLLAHPASARRHSRIERVLDDGTIIVTADDTVVEGLAEFLSKGREADSAQSPEE